MYLKRPGVADWTVTSGDLDEFRDGIDPLAEAGRLAAVLLQFPSSFHAETDTSDYLDWLLPALVGVSARRRASPSILERRRERDTRGSSRAHRAAWVRIDEPKFAGLDRAGLLGRLPTTRRCSTCGSTAGTRVNWWRHDERRGSLRLSVPTARSCGRSPTRHRRASAAGRRVVMYLNNHFSAKAVANAAVLKHQLGDLIPGDYPREMLDRYPELVRHRRYFGPAALIVTVLSRSARSSLSTTAMPLDDLPDDDVLAVERRIGASSGCRSGCRPACALPEWARPTMPRTFLRFENSTTPIGL